MNKIKKIISIVMIVLTIFSCVPITALASTSTAKEIDSTFLFEESTLDELKLNFNSMPTIEVAGLASSQYKIYDANQLWWWSEKKVKNKRIEFSNQALDFDTHYPNLKLTVTYSNCGTLNGNNIDVVLTYSDFWTATETGNQRYDTKTLWWTAYGTPEEQNSDNEWFMVGFSKFNLDIKFKYHNSNSFINLDNAYFTLYSMDGTTTNGKITHAEAAASDIASNAYWYKERNMSYSSSFNNGTYSVKNMYYGTKSHTSGNRDTKNALCLQYENEDSINLDMIVAYGSWSEGYHVNFTPLTAVIPKAPTKTISTDKITENSNIDYTVTQSLPKSYDDEFYLKSFEIEDTLDSSLNYVSASLINEDGKDITSIAGDLNYANSTQTVTYSFDTDYLKSIDYNGQEVTLEISANTEDGIDKEAIVNTATTRINNNEYFLKSNTTSVNVYYPVTVNYIDETGNKLSDSYSFDCFVGQSYETQSRNIDNYTLIEVPSIATGKVKNAPITVNYVYRLKDTSVVVNYVDEEGKALTDSITIEGKVCDEYTTEEKTFEGYELTEIPTNASGNMTEEPITVNYVYRLKDTSVVVNYVDDEGNALTDSITIEGKVFDEYTTEEKTFEGYELTEIPNNASGTMTEDTITVSYVYTKKDTSITTNYIDEQGKSIADSITITGKVKDKYTTSAKDIYGYELITTPSNASGIMTEEPITVNYVYRLKDASVVVNYVDEEGKALTGSITVEGKVFDEYTTEEKDFYGYKLTAVPTNAKGTMTEEPIIVNYVYRLKDTSVVVNYVDDEGKPLTDSITIEGKVFDEYTTEEKDFYGYKLTAVPTNASGTMAEEPITVNYVYRLKDTSVVVNYVDDEGKPLTDSITIEGKVFDEYNTEEKTFEGYALLAIPSNASGNMTEDVITVNYVYRLKDTSVVVNYVDEEGNALTDGITIEGKVFDEYTTEEKTFEGYALTKIPTNASGNMTEDVITVNYVYRLKDASVVVNYVDEEGKALTDSITIEGKVFDEYNTEEKTFEGYALTEIPTNASGNMTETSIIVNYIYSKVEEPVDIPYTGDNGTNIILFTSLFVVDIILVGVLTIIIKRKNKKEENK